MDLYQKFSNFCDYLVLNFSKWASQNRSELKYIYCHSQTWPIKDILNIKGVKIKHSLHILIKTK